MPAVKRKRKFAKVSKSRKGVPKVYLKGAKNPKKDYEAVERSRAKDKRKVKRKRKK
jgi:hypothetical protein